MRTIFKALILSIFTAFAAMPAFGALRPSRLLLGAATATAMYKKDDIKQAARAARGAVLDEVSKQLYPEEYQGVKNQANSVHSVELIEEHKRVVTDSRALACMQRRHDTDYGDILATKIQRKLAQKAQTAAGIPLKDHFAVYQLNEKTRNKFYACVATGLRMFVHPELGPSDYVMLLHEAWHIKNKDYLGSMIPFHKAEARAESEAVKMAQCAQCVWNYSLHRPSYWQQPIKSHFFAKRGYLERAVLRKHAQGYHRAGKYCDYHDKDRWKIPEAKPFDYVW